MATKLKLTPNVSYVLGIYEANKKLMQPIGIITKDNGFVERFVKIAMDDLGIDPTKIMVREDGVHFYNSKIKKLFDKALERRAKIFKYSNDYSGSYLAGLFDCAGGMDRKGMYIKGMDPHDGLLMENLGVHTHQQGSKSYIQNEKVFVALVGRHSQSKFRPV